MHSATKIIHDEEFVSFIYLQAMSDHWSACPLQNKVFSNRKDPMTFILNTNNFSPEKSPYKHHFSQVKVKGSLRFGESELPVKICIAHLA